MPKPVIVKVGADASDLQSTLGGVLSGLKQTLMGIHPVVGLITAVVVGLGAAAFQMGEEFDAATDKIRIGTGATGEQLDALMGSFDAVFATVPTTAGEAATAIADLNTRLGLTGEPLENLATQFLNLSRITGTDLQGNIQAITRVFGDWSIATEDQSGALDFLFRTSQSTGIEVDKLSNLIVQFGAPLRQLGFDFEQSAALMGKFEQEGVNIETVMSGLRIGLANLARAGVDGAEGMQAAITAIKEAGTQAEANEIAIAIFGQRAGPDMAAAVREGRFELDELLGTLRGGPETINGAAAATDDFWESLTQIWNAIKVSVRPAVEGFFNLLSSGLGPVKTGLASAGSSKTFSAAAAHPLRVVSLVRLVAVLEA